MLDDDDDCSTLSHETSNESMYLNSNQVNCYSTSHDNNDSYEQFPSSSRRMLTSRYNSLIYNTQFIYYNYYSTSSF